MFLSKLSCRNFLRLICASIGLLAQLALVAPSKAQNALLEAIEAGQPLLRMHGRAEFVGDESNTLEDATALTWRTYFGYQTGELANFSVRVAAENVRHLVDDFNVPGYASRGFDIVADPEDTELEEAFLRYTGLANTTMTLGRQYVTFRPAPMHRFVGTVPWRQNWQSMDAFSVENNSIENLRLSYAYIDEVNRIFGEDNPDENLARSPMSSHLLNVQYSGLPNASLEGFYYRLDYDRDTLPAAFTDRQTVGAKLEGRRAFSDDLAGTYLVELSHQRAIEDNTTSFDSANQYRIEFGLSHTAGRGILNGVSGKLGYEVLESDGGISFATPLATVHAFQGWADRFIGFPGAGVKDTYLSASFTFARNFSLTTVLHDFGADVGGFDYGQEFDFQLTKRIDKITLSLKHASYSGSNDLAAGAIGTDKTITWLFVGYAM